MKKLSLIILALTLTAAAARADVSIQSDITGLKNATAAGGALLSNGTYVMILDLNNNGIQNLGPYTSQAAAGVDSASSWQWDAGDLLLLQSDGSEPPTFNLTHFGIGPLGDTFNGPSDGEAYLNTNVTTAQLPADYNAAHAPVDHVYLLWFAENYNASATGPGAGVHYGVYDMGTGFIDAGSYTAPHDLSNGKADFVTAAVPEPATLSLLAFGGLVAIGRRIARRRAA